MATTTDKQRQALEAKGWTLDRVDEAGWIVAESWIDMDGSERPSVNVFNDNTVGINGYVDRHRLAEFLSIINAKDETVTIEGVVALRGPFFVGNVYMPDHLRSREGKRVRVTIEEVAE
jgi:hypothetical protein